MEPTMCELKQFDRPYRVLGILDFPNLESLILHGTGRIYGRMLQVAFPIIKQYHSDLAYDCIQLMEYIRTYVLSWGRPARANISPPMLPLELYWSLDDSGTYLVKNEELHDICRRKFAFKLSIWIDNADRHGDGFMMLKMERLQE